MIKTTLGSQFTLTTQLVTPNVCKLRKKSVAACKHSQAKAQAQLPLKGVWHVAWDQNCVQSYTG